LRRAAIIGTLVGLVLVAGTTSVSAHSYFITSDPEDGSMLAKPPDHIFLVFSSPVDTHFSDFQLIEAKGAKYAPSKVVSFPGYKQAIEVGLPSLPEGSYRLTFTVVDALDFHKTTGTTVFGIGMPAPQTAAAPQPTPAQPREVALRWLALAGFSGLLGGLAIGLVAIRRLPEEPEVQSRLRRSMFGVSMVGTVGVVLGEAGLLLQQASLLGPIFPSSARLLSGSEFGTRWWITMLIALGLLPLLLSLRKSSGGNRARFRWSAVLVLCVALTVALAFSGHVAGASGTSISGITLLTLHIGSMGVWAGGVCALALTMWNLHHITGNLERASMVSLVVGFGQIAAVAFAVLGVTGLLLSGLQVASITALLSTQYGMFLIAKVLLIGVVALIALRHALLTWKALGRRGRRTVRLPSRLPATIALEGIGALSVVLLASVLGASAPAQGPQFEPPQSTLAITQETRAQSSLLTTLSVKPNRSGPNLVSVVVANKSWPATPAQAVSVVVTEPGGLTQTLSTTASDKPSGNSFTGGGSTIAFDAGLTRLEAGDATFTINVMRQGFPPTTIVVPWKVAALPVRRASVVVSDQPLAPLVTMLAILGALIALAVITAGAMRGGGGGPFWGRRTRGPRSGAKVKLWSAPHFARRLGDRRQLGDLVVDRDGVADNRGGEAALWTESDPRHVKVTSGLRDPV
jgi:copper transport protein